MGEDVEVAFLVRVSAAVVKAHLVAVEDSRCGLAETVGQLVSLRLATACVTAPAYGIVPFAAASSGHHHNIIYKNVKFKGYRVDVDAIYLTKEEHDAMMKAYLSGLDPAAELARDIFMVGVWTAQRVSDYHNISRDAIHTTKKHWIEEVPDPEHEGETIPTTRTKEITYIDILKRYIKADQLDVDQKLTDKYDYFD